MRNKGSGSQIKELLEKSKILKFGHSKHDAKPSINEAYHRNCKVEDIAPSFPGYSHALGISLPIFSYSTMHTYVKVWKQVLKFAKEQRVKDLENITSKIIYDFLMSKIDQNCSRRTFKKYCAACVKLQSALNAYSISLNRGNVYDFGLAPGCEIRQRAKKSLIQVTKNRAYRYPNELLVHLSGIFLLLAILQYRYGLRIEEALTLRRDNMEQNPIIRLRNTKGGLKRVILLSAEDYQLLKDFIEQNDGRLLRQDKKIKNMAEAYRRKLRQAANKTVQEYQGSHGLRWNYAQETFYRYILNGITLDQSSALVSLKLGHRRPSITAYYLRQDRIQ